MVTNFNGTYDEFRIGVDQIRNVLHTVGEAWNPEQLSQMALSILNIQR